MIWIYKLYNAAAPEQLLLRHQELLTQASGSRLQLPDSLKLLNCEIVKLCFQPWAPGFAAMFCQRFRKLYKVYWLTCCWSSISSSVSMSRIFPGPPACIWEKSDTIEWVAWKSCSTSIPFLVFLCFDVFVFLCFRVLINWVSDVKKAGLHLHPFLVF